MKAVEELLAELGGLGVELWLEGDRLRYSAPREVLTPANLAELRERQREIRDFLRGASGRLPPIPRAPAGGVFPLSVAQEEFWSLEQWVPGNSFSNVFAAFLLTGPLDVAALTRTFDEIVRRHDVLRTTFATVDGRPAQVVSSGLLPFIGFEDFSDLSKAEREFACSRRIIQDTQQPFDLAHGPLLRVTLIVMAEQEHLLLLTMHHIITDVWSLLVLVLEIAALYEAVVEGRGSPLPELPVQYADFAVWQRRLLDTHTFDGQLSYWKKQLSNGDLPSSSLPTDYPRPASVSFHTSGQTAALPETLSAALKRRGHEEGCTLFMVLLSVLKIALSSVSGEHDIRVGTLVAARNHEQLDKMIGLFINTLVLRTDLGGDPTLRAVLARVRETVLEAYDQQDLPFETLVQAMEREQPLERGALFRVLFLFGNPPPPSVRAGELSLKALDVGKGLLEANADLTTVTTFDLILTLAERPQGITGTLVYKSALFSPGTISRMLAVFGDVAERVASRPDERLSALPPFAHA